MLKKYRRQVFLIAVFCLVSVIFAGIIMVAYEALIGHSNPLIGISNLLFLEGALVFICGAILEFFMKSSSKMVYISFLNAYEAFAKRDVLQSAIKESRSKDEEGSGGWMMIIAGTAIIALSLIFAALSGISG